MALTELTKVTGPGIHTLSNILSHNIKSSGIITATKFSGPLDSIGGNFAGVITATNGVFSGNISAVDGNFSGNVTIGGTLTYEDVTNIDSVGIITAQKDIHVGAGVSAVGVGTFGSLDIGGDIDVDGHTNLDNVSIAGVTTHSSEINMLDNQIIRFGTAAASRTSIFYDSSGSNTWIKNFNDTLKIGYRPVEIYYVNQKRLEFINGGNRFTTDVNTTFLGDNYHASWSPGLNKFQLNDNAKLAFGSQADATIHHNNANLLISNTTGNIDVTGNVVLNNDISVDGHTNLDNVSVAGVTTTAGTFNAANIVQVGTTNDTGELRIGHDGSNYRARIVSNSSNRLTIDADGPERIQMHGGVIYIRPLNTEISAGFVANGPVELYHDNVKTAFTGQDQWIVYGRTSNSGMVEIASNQGANNNDRFRIHKTSAASRLTIQNYSTGSWVENIRITAGGAVELKHADGTTRLQTTSTGAQIDTILKLYGAAGNPGKLQLQEGGALSEIRVERSTDTSSALLFGTEISGTTATRWKIDTAGHFIPGAVGSYDIGSASAEVGNIFLADSKKVFLGSDQDTEIYHNGTHSYLTNTTGNFFFLNSGTSYSYFDSNFIRLRNQAGNHMIQIDNSGAAQGVKLFHTAGSSGSQTLATTATGIEVTGKVVASGEIEASQDYPNFRPTLDFNFAATKKLDPRLEYQRTGTASFTDEFGKVVLVGDNAPRFDHDPVTRESKGLLIEEARTNNNKSSVYQNNFTGWTKSNFDHQEYSSETAPDGSSNVTLVSTNNASTTHYAYISHSGAAFTGARTISAWFKKLGTTTYNPQLRIFGVGNGISYANFVLTGDGTVNSGGSDTTAATITPYPNGWYRCTLSWNDSTSHYGGGIVISNNTGAELPTYTGDADITKGFLVYGFQDEAGAFPTSYIPTNGSTATRGGDHLTMTGSDLTDVFNNEEGTMFYEASLEDITNDNQPIVAFRDLGTVTDNYHAMGMRIGGGSSGNIRTWFKSNNANTYLSNHASTGLTSKMFYKHIYGYKLNDAADAYSTATNSAILTDNTVTPMITSGVVDELRFGEYYSLGNTYKMDAGHIKRFSYWTQKLTNTQLTTYIS